MQSLSVLYNMKYWETFKVVDSVVSSLLNCPITLKQYITNELHQLLLQYTWCRTDTLHTLLHNNALRTDVLTKLESQSVATHIKAPALPMTPSSSQPDTTLQRSTTSYSNTTQQHTIDCNAMLLYYRKLNTLIADRLHIMCHDKLLNVSIQQIDACFNLIYYVITQCTDICIDTVVLLVLTLLYVSYIIGH